jgi:hypothetical protein
VQNSVKANSLLGIIKEDEYRKQPILDECGEVYIGRLRDMGLKRSGMPVDKNKRDIKAETRREDLDNKDSTMGHLTTHLDLEVQC